MTSPNQNETVLVKKLCVVCPNDRVVQHELCERHIEAFELRADLLDNEDKSFEFDELLSNAYLNSDMELSFMRNSKNHQLARLLVDKGILRNGKQKIPSPFHIRFKLSREGKKIAELCYLENQLKSNDIDTQSFTEKKN